MCTNGYNSISVWCWTNRSNTKWKHYCYWRCWCGYCYWRCCYWRCGCWWSHYHTGRNPRFVKKSENVPFLFRCQTRPANPVGYGDEFGGCRWLADFQKACLPSAEYVYSGNPSLLVSYTLPFQEKNFVGRGVNVSSAVCATVCHGDRCCDSLWGRTMCVNFYFRWQGIKYDGLLGLLGDQVRCLTQLQ